MLGQDQTRSCRGKTRTTLTNTNSDDRNTKVRFPVPLPKFHLPNPLYYLHRGHTVYQPPQSQIPRQAPSSRKYASISCPYCSTTHHSVFPFHSSRRRRIPPHLQTPRSTDARRVPPAEQDPLLAKSPRIGYQGPAQRSLLPVRVQPYCLRHISSSLRNALFIPLPPLLLLPWKYDADADLRYPTRPSFPPDSLDEALAASLLTVLPILANRSSRMNGCIRWSGR